MRVPVVLAMPDPAAGTRLGVRKVQQESKFNIERVL